MVWARPCARPHARDSPCTPAPARQGSSNLIPPCSACIPPAVSRCHPCVPVPVFARTRVRCAVYASVHTKTTHASLMPTCARACKCQVTCMLPVPMPSVQLLVTCRACPSCVCCTPMPALGSANPPPRARRASCTCASSTPLTPRTGLSAPMRRPPATRVYPCTQVPVYQGPVCVCASTPACEPAPTLVRKHCVHACVHASRGPMRHHTGTGKGT